MFREMFLNNFSKEKIVFIYLKSKKCNIIRVPKQESFLVFTFLSIINTGFFTLMHSVSIYSLSHWTISWGF